jgi:divalent metal cation (Fe/Co/Zn/Cd) transporter
MAKQKKNTLSFLLLITAVYGAWTTIQKISGEFNIPIPILAIIILVLYWAWK